MRISRRMFLRSAAASAGATALTSLSCSPCPVDPIVSGWLPIRFGIITDCHYADADPSGTRFYRDSLDKLSECVDRMNAERVNFLIELGDFKDQNTPPVESRTLTYLCEAEAVFGRFQGPRYHVLGNHDMDSLSKKQFLSEIENTGIGAARSYYSFDVFGTLHFVVLDANYRADGCDYDHGNFDWTDANVPPHELDWLKQDLAGACGSVVVFVHQRLDGEGPLFARNASEMHRILRESGKVHVVFQGHHHEGGYSRIDGIHYYTLKAMVEGQGSDNNSYAIVEMHRDRSMTLTGCRKAASMELPGLLRG